MKIIAFLLAASCIVVPFTTCIAVSEFKKSMKGHIDWRLNELCGDIRYNESQLASIKTLLN